MKKTHKKQKNKNKKPHSGEKKRKHRFVTILIRGPNLPTYSIWMLQKEILQILALNTKGPSLWYDIMLSLKVDIGRFLALRDNAP